MDQTKSKGIHFSHNLLYGILEVYQGTDIETKLREKRLLQKNPNGIYQTYKFLNPKVAFLVDLVTTKLAPKTKQIDEQIREALAKFNGHSTEIKQLRAIKFELNEFSIRSFEELICMVDKGKISYEQISGFEERVQQQMLEYRNHLKNIQIDL